MSHDLVSELRSGGFSLVVESDGLRTFSGRGVSDLRRLLKEEPALIRGASLADKVVGKGAAALMALAGVRRVYAEVISRPALAMLKGENVEVTYGELVDHIINRAGTGLCPLEERCMPCKTLSECLEQIDEFINEMRQSK